MPKSDNFSSNSRENFTHHGNGFTHCKGGLSKVLLHVAASIFFLMMALFIFMQTGNGSWFRNIKAEITSQPYARTITVNGEGKVTSKPDLAMVSLAVTSVGKTVKEVTQDNNSKMNEIIAELKKMQIEEKDIMTSEYSLYPQYEPVQILPVYNERVVSQNQPPKIIGYNLTQTIAVKVRNLETVDQVLDTATTKGANQIGSLSFEIDDSSKIKQEAREKAFQAARDKAEAMAKSAGVKIGRVVTFYEDFGGYPMPYANFAMEAQTKAADAGIAPSIQPGSKELNINVSVTYEIE